MLSNSTVIITPVYKKNISDNEHLSIKSSCIHLKDYDQIIIAPNKFSKDQEFINTWNNYGYIIVFFEDKYFLNVDSYNKLMMNKMFYKHFSNYTYMLIVQLDVLVFSDSLEYWIEKEIDYVGAPWIVKDFNGIRFNFAGNGGLSLRKIDTFIEVLESNKFFKKQEHFDVLPITTFLRNILMILLFSKFKITKYFSPLFKFLYKGQEDYFWAYYATFFVQKFKIANIEESLAFSFERYPEFCFEQNNHCMPLGVHAWERYNPEFWKKHKASIFTSSITSSLVNQAHTVQLNKIALLKKVSA